MVNEGYYTVFLVVGFLVLLYFFKKPSEPKIRKRRRILKEEINGNIRTRIIEEQQEIVTEETDDEYEEKIKSDKVSGFISFVAGVLISGVFTFIVAIIIGLVWRNKSGWYWIGALIGIVLCFLFTLVFILAFLGTYIFRTTNFL